jgi:hypothetical protein
MTKFKQCSLASPTKIVIPGIDSFDADPNANVDLYVYAKMTATS